jgi:hypothetical protein
MAIVYLTLIVVSISLNIVLLPVAKGNLQHPYRLIPRTAETMPLTSGYPYLIPGLILVYLIFYLYKCPIIDHDP